MIHAKFHKTLGRGSHSFTLDVDFEVNPGEFVVLYGDSGAGKTSILRVLAGLLKPETGSLGVHGETWFDSQSKIHLKPRLRNIGMVFQDYALFPHLTVEENLRYALHKGGENNRIDQLLGMVDIDALRDRKPEALSGGQSQRVALARALVNRPSLLLLDEPLAALDFKLRLRLRQDIQKLHREMGTTTFMVSHDLAEINLLADRVLVVDNGRISRQGSPGEIFATQDLSAKFRVVGEILKIEKEELFAVVTVLAEQQQLKVIAREEELDGIDIGDKVVVAAKAFNPIIYKLEPN